MSRRPFDRTPSERAFDRIFVFVILLVTFSGVILSTKIPGWLFAVVCCVCWRWLLLDVVRTWHEPDNRVLRISSSILLLLVTLLMVGLLFNPHWHSLLNTNRLE